MKNNSSQCDQLNYRVFGNGHPVLFIHGFMESLNMWDHLALDDLPGKKILIDLPGHGSSPLGFEVGEPSLDLMAERVIRLLNELKVDSFDVVGHSMGGYIALILKKKCEGCGKVVLLNSNCWDDNPEKKRDRIRVADLVLKAKDLFVKEAVPGLFYRHKRSDEEVQALTEEALKMSPEAIAYAALAMRNRSDLTGLLAEKTKDFMIIQGAHDPLVSAELLSVKLGNIPVLMETIGNAGHMAHIESTQEVEKAIASFLQ